MIKINIEKAKAIAHNRRRAARAAEFAPLDEIIAKKIPGESAKDTEAKRESIRTKYAAVQSEIDAAADVAGLHKVIADRGI
jgi:hypothetical protein